MKFYNVEQAELAALTVLDGIAAVFLSLALSTLFFCIGANWDLLLTAGLRPEVMAEARATRTAAAIACVAFFVLTAGAVVWRFVIINDIKSSSTEINVKPK